MSSKLKIKPKKRKLPLAQNNQAAQAFGRAMQNASSQLKEMEKKDVVNELTSMKESVKELNKQISDYVQENIKQKNKEQER